MRIRPNQKILYCLVMGLWLGRLPLPGSSLACWAEVKGSLELLDRIAVAHTSNREKVATWEGEVLVEIYAKRSEKLVEQTAEVRFAFDRGREAWLYHWTYVKTRGGALDGAQSGGMFLDSSWHSCVPQVPGKNTVQGVAVRPGAPPSGGPMTAAFDPMYYFKVRDDELKEKIENWLNHADSEWLTLLIEREGDRVTVDQGNVNIPFATARYVFDLSQGGNMTSLVGRDDVREERWSTDWEERAGVWLPKRSSYENEKHEGDEVSRKTVSWQRSVLNEPIAEETFTLDTMGVVPGALISDHRVGKQWRYKADEFAEAESEPPPLQGRRGRALVAVACSVLLLGLVAGILAWRRRGGAG
jgi:hypothetical protein